MDTFLLLVGVHNCACVPFYGCNEPKGVSTFRNYVIDERIKNNKTLCYSSQSANRWTNCKTPECGRSSPSGSNDLLAPGARNCVCVPYYVCDDGRMGEDTSCPSLHRCCALNDVMMDVSVTPKNLKKPGCGWRNPDGVLFGARSDDTGEAEFGEFPWMIAIYEEYHLKERSVVQFQCGGTLIHPKAVLTAAHCVRYRVENYVVRAGEWDLRSTTEIYPSQDRRLNKIITHRYHEYGLYNDIAFLLLESPFEMSNPNIGVACLPRQGTSLPSGTRCFATGWGNDLIEPEGKRRIVLKKIDLRLIGRNDCQGSLRTTKLGKFFSLYGSFICARGGSTRKGDSGGALVCPIPGFEKRYQQVGIVSWRNEEIVNVFTDVPLFRDWINHQAIINRLDTSAYTY